GAQEREDVGVVLPVVREHGGDHLGLAVEALREERTEGAVDQAGGEDLLLRRPALALEEAAGDLPGGEGLLLVVAGEGEEVDALARGGERRRRDQDDGLAELHEGGPPGLLGHAAGLDRQVTAVKIDLHSLVSGLRHQRSLLRGSRPQQLCTREGEKEGRKDGSYLRMPSCSITLL